MRTGFFIFIPVFLLGCSQEERVREPYTEIRMRAAPPAAAAGQAEGMEWTKPEGWFETPADPTQSGGIQIQRIAKFAVREGGEEALVTITAFPTSGGIPANLDRWLRQLLASPSPAERQDFLENQLKSFQTEGEREGTYADLSRFVPEDPTAGSMLTGTIPLEDGRVIYVKMTGPRGLLANEAEAFQALCRSLR